MQEVRSQFDIEEIAYLKRMQFSLKIVIGWLSALVIVLFVLLGQK